MTPQERQAIRDAAQAIVDAMPPWTESQLAELRRIADRAPLPDESVTTTAS